MALLSQKERTLPAAQGDTRCAACGYANSLIARYCQHCGAQMIGLRMACTGGDGSAVRAGARSDRGLVRTTQSDLVLVEQLDQSDGGTAWLGLVASGIGSQHAGAYASHVAGKSVATLLRELLAQPLGIASYARLLRTAVAGANSCVFTQSQACAELRGMGSTLTTALLAGNHVFIAQVGDSRAYKLRATGALAERLTTDHTIGQRMLETGKLKSADLRAHPQAQVCYRRLGEYAKADIDLTITSLAAGESILLCSNGLVKHVDDDELVGVVHAAPTPQDACDQLIALSNQRGGCGSTSVVLLQVVARFA